MPDSAEIHYLYGTPPLSSECDWPGSDGRHHRFHIYPRGTAFIRAEAVFILARRVAETLRFAPLYVGATDDLRASITELRASGTVWRDAVEAGFDSVHVHYEHAAQHRRAVREALIEALDPELNRDLRREGPAAVATGAMPGARPVPGGALG